MLPTFVSPSGLRARGRTKGGSSRTGAASRLVLLVGLPLCALALLLCCSAWLAGWLASLHGAAGRSRVEIGTGDAATAAALDLPSGLPPAPADCPAVVASWLQRSEARAAARAASPLANLTFFLHVPRTAGRTLFFCALKPAWAPSQRCERAYDHLRLDPGRPGCGLLSSHDDFRLVEQFPGRVTLLTQLRDPVDRLLSAYEFAVEVAARGLGQRDKVRRPKAPARTETTAVWPWSELVPLVAADMDARHAALAGPDPPARSPTEHAYDNALAMPLSAFAAHPAVHSLLHNGASFQLLGLTANALSDGDPTHELTSPDAVAEAAVVRSCVAGGGHAMEAVKEHALSRLRSEVSVVTLKDRLGESVSMLAASLKRPLSSRSYRTLSDAKDEEARGSVAKAGDAAAIAAAAAAMDAASRSGAASLGAAFSACEKRQRDKMGSRRGASLKKLGLLADGSPVAFARSAVPVELLAAVRRYNELDDALYAQGRTLFEARKALFISDGSWEDLEAAAKGPVKEDGAVEEGGWGDTAAALQQQQQAG